MCCQDRQRQKFSNANMSGIIFHNIYPRRVHAPLPFRGIPRRLQPRQFLHGLQSRGRRRPAKAEHVRLCQTWTKYFLYFCKLSCILQYYVTFWNPQHISYFYLLHFHLILFPSNNLINIDGYGM